MNWFKHDTNATTDAKIKKLLIKYGAIGYAIYFHCLELIASNVSENNITFELEHDAEIIADDLRIKGDATKSGTEIVEEIMRYMVGLDLFEESNGHIFCFKLLKRLDTSMTSNPKMRALISSAKENHDTVMTNHDTIMQEKIRIDEIRKDKNLTPEKKVQKQKKESLRNREPENDLEKIEKTYIQLWDSLYSQNKVNTQEPIITDWQVIRSLEKGLLQKNIPVEVIQNAILNSVNHNLVVQSGYSLKIILSGNIINQLINGGVRNQKQKNKFTPIVENTHELTDAERKEIPF